MGRLEVHHTWGVLALLKRMPDFESRSGDWLSLDEALERILRGVSPLPPETVPLEEALGRALTEDALTPRQLPPWDNSAMDGYAIQGDDVAGATETQPAILTVTGVIHAGTRFDGTVRSGEAVRIMTGAEVPDGADTVIRVEDTDREESEPGKLRVCSDRDRGRHVRPAGQDWPEGAIALRSGRGLGPGQIAVLAAARKPLVSVHRRPTVAILASGDELVDLASPTLDDHGIPESNSHFAAAGVRSAGGTPIRLGIAKDDPEDILHHLDRAAEADVLITLGGASMGEGDLFKTVLDGLGIVLEFWRVKIRPGSPVSFGYLPREGRSDQAVFGLPGNPASTFVTFEILVRPFLLALAGHDRLRRQSVSASAAEDLSTAEDLTGFLRVRLSGSGADLQASLTGPQGSGLVMSLGAADGLAVIPEGVSKIPRGAQVEVMLLDDPGASSSVQVNLDSRTAG
ncbi:MAG TPA: molybdopterin molybdotransferase MoeA [Gemmatimonadetes bacterium]|nr:molybdopterin molybdotransferase MoeA [Gemmatimonadota bacterium]